MSLEKASIVWTAKQIKGMIGNGKINFEHIVQRSYVWEKSRKSKLIESMILGYPVPMIYAKRIIGNPEKRGDNTYYIMDGKQRLSTIAQFLNDEFELTEISEVKYYDEIEDMEKICNISGMKFSELPEAIRDNLLTITFNITYFDNLTQEEEIELFKRLNNGKPLSAKAKLLASCKDLNGIINIGKHEVFNKMLSEKSLDNKNQVSIVMKCWMMLNRDIEEISFESKYFNPVVENTTISETEKVELMEIFDTINAIHDDMIDIDENKIAKKLFTETHFISLVPFVKNAIEKRIDVEEISSWIIDFFKNVSEEYKEASTSGVAKAANIITRYEEIEKHYTEYFAE